MKENFWTTIKKPVIALAPMEDVTDTVFREIIMGISDPDCLHVVFAEFTSTDGMCHPVGKDKVSHRLQVNASEREMLKEKKIKIVAQIWGSDPEKFARAARIICDEYDFDGIDINMGCPVKKIVKQASCSELIKYPELAKEIVIAAKESSDIPVSVKTRTGINKHITQEWMEHLLSVDPACITLHCRTQKMMSDYPAEWDEIGKAVETRSKMGSDVPVLGNGDLMSMEDCYEKVRRYNIDGVMVGRGIFKNPWFFNNEKKELSPELKMKLLWDHVKLFTGTWGRGKNFAILKRFFKIYTYDFYGASEIRARLMETANLDEVRAVLLSAGYNTQD